RRRGVGVGEVERDAVVRPERAHLEPQRVAQARTERDRPRSVDPRPAGREDAAAPVADLVPEALDDDGAVGGAGAGRRRLLGQEGEEVPGGALVEGVLVAEPRERLLLRQRDELARRAPDRLAELVRPPHALALPERYGARNARG